MSDTTDVTSEVPTAPESPARRRRTGGGLTGMLLGELQTMAASLGISGTGRMRKGELIEAIQNRQGGDGHVPGPRSENRAATEARGHDAARGAAPRTEVRAEVRDGDGATGDVLVDEQRAPRRASRPAGPPQERERTNERERGTDRERTADRDGERTSRGPGDRNGRVDRDNRLDRDTERNGRDHRGAERRDTGERRDDRRDGDRRDAERRDDRRDGDRRDLAERGRDTAERGRDTADRGRDGTDRRDDDDDADGGGRRGRRSRFRDRRRGRGERGSEGGGAGEPQVAEDDVLVQVAGIVDVLENYAFVRTSGYLSGPNDVYVSMAQIKK
ncbi:MAG: Rho termination factor N-terminal domain-containing protein, partial [Micromonosporaceae bacterium]